MIKITRMYVTKAMLYINPRMLTPQLAITTNSRRKFLFPMIPSPIDLEKEPNWLITYKLAK